MASDIESRLSRLEGPAGEAENDPWVMMYREQFPDMPAPRTHLEAVHLFWRRVSDSLDDPPKMKAIEAAHGERS
jgi:hypothetical protein